MPRSTPSSSASPGKKKKTQVRSKAKTGGSGRSSKPSSSSAPLVIDSDDEDEEDEDDEEPEYEVEAIRGHQFVSKKGGYKFLVKWLGYPESDNTWEPEDNLNAGDLVDAYWEAQPKNNQPEKRAEYLGNTSNGGIGTLKKSSSQQKLWPSLRGGGNASSSQSSAKRGMAKLKLNVDTDDEDEDIPELRNFEDAEDEQQVEEDVELDEEAWAAKEAEWKAKYDPMTSWEDVVKKVSTLEKTAEGDLLAYLDFENGATLIYPTSIANIKCPQKLLHFYEDHLKFKEPERDTSQVSKTGHSKKR